jgi:hypothetical protein
MRKEEAMRGIKVSSDEQRWRSEEDARAVKRFAEIKNDKTRLAAANKILKDEAAATSKAVSMTRAAPMKKAAPKKKSSK